MYLFISFIVITFIFSCFFNYLKNKKLKQENRLSNLVLEVLLQVPVSYLLTVMYFRLIKNTSIPYILNAIWKNNYSFILSFHLIIFGWLAIILFLSFLLKIEIKKISENAKKAYVFSFIFVFFMMQFIMLIFYFDVMFANINISQILFVLNMPVTGTSSVIIIASVIALLFIPFCFSIFHLLLLKNNIGFVCKLYKKEKAFFPFSFNHKSILSFSLLALVLLFCEVKLQIVSYMLKEFRGNSSFYEENYIPPKDVTFTFPEHKKNLIFIYLESTEAEVAYCAKENTNLIPELAEIAKNNLSFSHSDGIGGQIQVPGTDHSIASVCCTHLGLPLLIDFAGQFYKNNSEYFFNGAYGLGNILQGGGIIIYLQ